MANTKLLRLSVVALFTKGPGKIYFYRCQAQELIPIIKASIPEIVAAHVEYAKGFKDIL